MIIAKEEKRGDMNNSHNFENTIIINHIIEEFNRNNTIHYFYFLLTYCRLIFTVGFSLFKCSKQC